MERKTLKIRQKHPFIEIMVESNTRNTHPYLNWENISLYLNRIYHQKHSKCNDSLVKLHISYLVLYVIPRKFSCIIFIAEFKVELIKVGCSK